MYLFALSRFLSMERHPLCDWLPLSSLSGNLARSKRRSEMRLTSLFLPLSIKPYFVNYAPVRQHIQRAVSRYTNNHEREQPKHLAWAANAPITNSIPQGWLLNCYSLLRLFRPHYAAQADEESHLHMNCSNVPEVWWNKILCSTHWRH